VAKSKGAILSPLAKNKRATVGCPLEKKKAFSS